MMWVCGVCVRGDVCGGVECGACGGMDRKRSIYGGSLVPRPSSHVRERGFGVLSDFSCHSSPI